MKLIKIIISLYLIGIITLFWITLQNYTGNSLIYILFTCIANLLLVYGFTSKALFFDAFIGLFFWLGFWIKFSLRIVMHQQGFDVSLLRDPSLKELDHSLIVSSVGFIGILSSSLIRSYFFNYKAVDSSNDLIGLFEFYKKNRNIIIIIFGILLIFISVTNMYFVIYQKGKISQLILPYGLNNVYKWLLLFGFSAMTSILIKFELQIDNKLNWRSICYGLIEPFISNTALLSRGMVLNAAAIGLGGLRQMGIKYILHNKYRLIAVAFIFTVLFSASVIIVNYMRAIDYTNIATNERNLPPNHIVISMTTPLFIDRWVGIESVVAVDQYKEKSFDLLRDAWSEEIDPFKNSFFDTFFIKSPYEKIDDRYYFITLPGLIAFLYYQGSLIFLFFLSLVSGIIGAAVELLAFYFAGRNLIFSSLIGQIIAYRYANFGYVPKNTYLLFLSILITICIIFYSDKILKRYA